VTNLRWGGAERQARALVRLGPASALSDGELLARFAGGDDEAAGPAFEALVERHGPMVLRVCRGVLGDRHAAEDAFQATFLVLVRRARAIRDRDTVASWLHGVALRVASHSRAAEARRRRHERAATRPGAPEGCPGDDLGPELHEALGRLPERLRAPVVLCYLEGHTCEDAARLLRRPVGTVKSRLARARDRLKRRLARLDPAGPSLGSFFPPGSAKPIPARLIAGAARVGAGPSGLAPGVVSLAEGVLKAMMIARGKVAAVALLAAVGFVFAGGSIAARPQSEKSRPEKPTAVARAAEPAPDPLIPRDLAVTAGAGRALVYALNGRGERIVDEEAREDLKVALAGDKPAQGPWKEAERDLRWVAITGVVDHHAIREAVAKGRGIDPARARLMTFDEILSGPEPANVERVHPAPSDPNGTS